MTKGEPMSRETPSVLIFSEMFPKPKSSSSGVFIVERLKALTELGVPFDFAPVSTFDNFPIMLLKKLKGYSPSESVKSVNLNEALPRIKCLS